MSVLGVGLDVVDVAAFGRQLDDGASGFVAATFTAAERRAVPDGGERRVLGLAGRFAAKEAFLKAWSASRRGRPPALARLDLREVEVVEDGYGRPALRLHGEVARHLAEGSGPPVAVHLSLSHDGPVAAAVVVLEAEPEREAGGRR